MLVNPEALIDNIHPPANEHDIVSELVITKVLLNEATAALLTAYCYDLTSFLTNHSYIY
jgi:hypothetical protein